MKIRLLPVFFIIFLFAIVVKTIDFFEGNKNLSEKVLFSELNAAENEEEVEEAEVTTSENYEGPTLANPGQISKMEKEILQSLAERREKLEEWEKSISLKENVLNATEKKIDKKMQELKNLKTQVSNLLEKYNEQDDEKISSLVKIYENMKPKDAAKIFEEIDINILLRVIDKMKEKKAAPILAKMDPKKARQITIELASQKQLN